MSTPATKESPNPLTANPSVRQRDLRAHAARWRRRQNRLAIALVIVMCLGALAVYLPLRATLAETRRNIEASEAELNANRERAAALPQLIATVDGLRRQVERYKPLRSIEDTGRAMQELSDIKESTRPDVYRNDGSSAEIRRPTCIERPLKLNFESDFVDAVSFVAKLESMDRLTRVRELTVRRLQPTGTNAKGGKVAVSMSFSLFFAATEGSAELP